MKPRVTAECTFTPRRDKCTVGKRIVHDAYTAFTLVHKSHGDHRRVKPTHEIRRAVDRIYHPCRHRGINMSVLSLFAEEGKIGVFFSQLGKQQLLNRLVGCGHKIMCPLFGNIGRAASAYYYLPCPARRLGGAAGKCKVKII